MRKLVITTLLFIHQLLFSQLSNPNDTLAIDNLGKKIELENNMELAEKWNNQIIEICNKRKKLKNLHPKILDYYRASHQASLLSTSYFEETKGNNKKAIQIQLDVLKELEKEKKKNNKLLGYVYRNIGNSLALEKEYEKSKFYIFKAIPYALKDEDKRNIGSLYNDLGFVCIEMKDFKSGLFYYSKSLVIFKQINSLNSIANTLHNIGRIYLNNKSFKKAKTFAEEAIVYNIKAKNYSQLSLNYSILYQIEKTFNNNEKAFYYLKKMNQAAITSKDLKSQLVSSESLYRHYKKINQKNLALKYLEENTRIDKILNKDENKNAMLKASFKYETEKKEAQIKALSQQKKIITLESERQKTIALALGILIVSLLIISYFLFNKYKIKKQNELLKSQLLQAEKTIQAEKKATESELKALKSQMNPHFIFNALSGIQDQFMYGDKTIANEQMGNFTYLTRQILSVSGKKQILLSTEIDILNKYLELEKMRFKTNFEYEINLLGNIDEDYHEIPPMLIQPFVENSIKHGLMHKSGLKTIAINFDLSSSEDYLICTIIDNGIGRQKSAEIKAGNLEKHNSFSTKSIQQRLELLNDSLQLQELIIYSDILENDVIVGTKVAVNIPLV
ncbi:histidine kinase [Flavobacterium eburneipallidum]|uniref:histidine kinase n=1 Tax=Flavobacterium eburneipallidum TaxID=3003263 RepID=UPI00248296C4|nr:histidine kinase [Flavobacterium eburneipallidum]